MDRSEAKAILGLPDLERAHAIKKFMDEEGWTQPEAARELGVQPAVLASFLARGKPTMQGTIMIEFWDSHNARFSSTSYDPQHYARLWREGNLKFQKEGKPKPLNYPDPNAVKT